MGEDSSHAERSSNSSSILVNPQQYQAQQDNMDLLVSSFSPSSAPSSPTNTLSRLGLKTPGSLGPGSPTSPTARDQVSAITVVALLDKLVNMLEAVQENQRRMELRQADLEGAVRGVQGDVTRLSKNHTSTSNSVNKLLERSRKVNTHMKDVRERLDKQASQVKRLEANHGHLLKRNHFKVLIFQEDNEIPSSVFIKDSPKTPQASQIEDDAPAAPALSVAGTDANRSQEEGLHTISLSSSDDDAGGLHEEDEALEGEATLGLGAARPSSERSRADRLKRSSLKKVDSLKKAFSRESIEKKMSKIGTKIVPPASREKIKKSFTPNHPKSPAAKSSSFKVSPMTFNVKKMRGEGEDPTQPGGSPSGHAHVEIPPLGSMDGDLPLAEVHSKEGLGVEGGEELASPSSTGSVEVELTFNGEAGSLECDLTTDRRAGLALPEHDDDIGEEDDEEEEQESPVEVKSPIPAATGITVEQAS
ncbi:caveolae-associated protein 2-like [Coregonus clupeaformis]|uniref:caveolae-associated protein 2-like n=1 Tax=Coregonus clupeaformis TaxID=59861 RepID=UPI001E1C2FDE|nr:caveolae-associated protein 2-like [Coregonus clupeaformis]